FKRVGDRVRFHVPGEFDSLTLLAWVRVDALPNVNNALMLSDGWKEGEMHWQIGSSGKVILGVRARPGEANAHYRTPEVVTPARWRGGGCGGGGRRVGCPPRPGGRGGAAPGGGRAGGGGWGAPRPPPGGRRGGRRHRAPRRPPQ